jgi:hypothetical protein
MKGEESPSFRAGENVKELVADSENLEVGELGSK